MFKTEFADKVVLVTGGSAGIGLACAHAFAKEGARIIIASRNPDRANKALKEISQKGGRAYFIQTDFISSESISNLFNEILSKYGQLDCAVNNAGIEGTPFVKTVEYQEKVWDKVIAINLKGVWLCMKHEIKQMLKQKGGGAIVNVSSYAGIRASKTGGAAYTASKHGVIGITKSAALEYARDHIRINAVCPAIIHTPNAEEVLGDKLKAVASDIHPMGRIGMPQEVADAALWLCSSKSSFITGESIAIDGGLQA